MLRSTPCIEYSYRICKNIALHLMQVSMQGVLPVQMLCSCCNNFAHGRNCFAGPALHPMPCELLCLCCTHSLTSLGLEDVWFAITEDSVTDKNYKQDSCSKTGLLVLLIKGESGEAANRALHDIHCILKNSAAGSI